MLPWPAIGTGVSYYGYLPMFAIIRLNDRKYNLCIKVDVEF